MADVKWNQSEKMVLLEALEMVISLNKRRRSSLGVEFVPVCDKHISDAEALKSKVASL